MCGDLPLALLLPEAADRCRPLLPPGVLVPPVAAARLLLLVAMVALLVCVPKIKGKQKSNDESAYENKTGLVPRYY